jgi:hypothetical protein
MIQSSEQREFGFVKPHGASGVWRMVNRHPLKWFRIGTNGDPSHDWSLTADVCEWLGGLRVPVVVTKHWTAAPDDTVDRLRNSGAIVNTSISALDTEGERRHRLSQFRRFGASGVKSVLRVVTCRFGETTKGRECNRIQGGLIEREPFIDNPLRLPMTHGLVTGGHVIAERRVDLGSVVAISVHSEKAYIGHCSECPDQCGVNL